MSTLHIAGCKTEDDAQTKALEYQDLGYHTVVAGAADTVQLEPATGSPTSPANFGQWIVVATKNTIETVAASASG